MSERDAFIEQMELEKGCGRPGGLPHNGSHDYADRWTSRSEGLAELAGSDDALQLALANAYHAYIIGLKREAFWKNNALLLSSLSRG